MIALADGENTVEVEVTNDLSPDYPYGKQKKNRGGMWYTPTSGIWQTVWLEPVPEEYIKEISSACDARGADITVHGMTEGVAVCGGVECVALKAFTLFVATSRSIVHSPHSSESLSRSPIQSGFFGEFSTGATAVMWLVPTSSPAALSIVSVICSSAFRDDVSNVRFVLDSPASQITVFVTTVPSG